MLPGDDISIYDIIKNIRASPEITMKMYKQGENLKTSK